MILVRERSASGFEVLLVQRASQLAFHGGAWVFPGGRVESAELSAGDELSAARLAARRETFEEAGLRLAPEALVPFSHWTTPLGMPKRFATWFFVAPFEAASEVRVDGGEILAHRWLTPAEALSLQAARTLELPPPTFVTLWVLRGFGRVRDVLDDVSQREPEVYVPRPRATPRGIVSLYRGDAAYDSAGGEVELHGRRHRLCMFTDGWSYLRDTP